MKTRSNKHRLLLCLLISAGSLALASCGLLETFGEALGGVCRRPLVVTTEEDKNDGACTSDDCSLREAVITANACDGQQEIVLQEDAIYRLTIEGRNEDAAANGDLDITDDVVILYRPEDEWGYLALAGPAVIDAMGIDRALDIHSGTLLSGPIWIHGGDADYGGAIRIAAGALGHFYLLQVAESSALWDGGGVYNEGDFMAYAWSELGGNRAKRGAAVYTSGISNLTGPCSIVENHAAEGAIFVAPGGEARLRACHIRDNFGGAIFNHGELTFFGGEIAYNETFDPGAPVWNPAILFNDEGASAELGNITLTGNYAGEGRGMLVLNRGTLTFTHVTLYQNQPLDIGLASYGGIIKLHNSILGQSGDRLCDGEVESSGGNVFEDSRCRASPELGDIIAGSSDSMGLLPLVDVELYWGFGLGFALEESSPAVDAGTDPCLPRDNHGTTRPIDGDGDGVARCDSGSYEYRLTTSPFHAPLPDDALVTPSTPEMREAISRPTGPTTCRSGPKQAYAAVGYLIEGQEVSLLHRNDLATWLEVQSLDVQVGPCWVAANLLDLPTAFDPMALDLGSIPPEPTQAPTSKPEDKPEVGCMVLDANNQMVCQVPCPYPEGQAPPCTK